MKFLLLNISFIVLFIGCQNHTKNQVALCQDTERSGCCSHHGGVCGCNASGRTICCDGKLSPTCTCRY